MGLGSGDGDVCAPTAWAPGVWTLRLQGARLGGCAAKVSPEGLVLGQTPWSLIKQLLSTVSARQHCLIAAPTSNNALI